MVAGQCALLQWERSRSTTTNHSLQGKIGTKCRRQNSHMKNEENFWCRGTKADQDKMIQKTYREASLDPEAKLKDDGKEEERRRESATHQNQPPKTRFGSEEEIQRQTAKEACKRSSEKRQDTSVQQAQPGQAPKSAKSAQGSSKREGSRSGPSAKVDLENSDSEHGGKEDPPSSDYQDRRVRRKSPKPQGPAIYAEASNEVFKKADPRFTVDRRRDQSKEEVHKEKECHQRTRS